MPLLLILVFTLQIYVFEINVNAKTNKQASTSTKKPIIKTAKDLEKYLNKNYSTLNTPVGKFYFTIYVKENDDINNPFDFHIQTSWMKKSDKLMEFNNSIKISKDNKTKTKQLLKNHQKNIAAVAMKYFPKKKIKGGFYEGWYKYPNIREDWQEILFYSWRNYNFTCEDILIDFAGYNDTIVAKFIWDTGADTWSSFID